MAPFCTPAATAAPHASPTPLTSSRKHIAMCLSPKLGGSQRARIASSAAPQVRALSPAPTAEEAAAAPLPSPAPAVNVEYLAAEFAGHGVGFEPVGRSSCAVKMALSNGSVAHLLLPSGLVTSYKPAMWHGTVTEVLHTNVAEGPGGRPVVRGGVSVDLRCAAASAAGGWSPNGAWSLRDVRGSPNTSIEIELAAAAARCVVTLHPEALSTEVAVTNTAPASSMALSCGVSNHLRVSTPDATYALGLQGSDYRSVDPALSEFSIIPPDYGAAAREPVAGAARRRWASRGFDMILSGAGRDRGAEEDRPDGEEDDDYKHMTDAMCRVYSHAPREFTIIDRGRRNSVCLHRRGFEELYVFSPGSQYQWYGKYAYVVVGPAMLEPVVLGPGETWQGAQYLRNPNL
ncbi:unnamed protein product [Urochloa decumbens]|uniref:Protein NDH-DEPENDENT CYCLIC ELECTRON FLOW 5 n=1 Tax=Urochloa decumbens TaxID=240449 RepID=A0ABC8X2R6_9POAL